jgi:hypothetical protein
MNQIKSQPKKMIVFKNFKSILDMATKRRKKHKNQISGLIISMGYETEIREF